MEHGTSEEEANRLLAQTGLRVIRDLNVQGRYLLAVPNQSQLVAELFKTRNGRVHRVRPSGRRR